MNRQSAAIIIQARMSSERFPEKMMAKLGGTPLIDFIYERCCGSSAKNILVATSEDESDDILYNHCRVRKIPIMRGDLHNVLNRYIEAAELLGAKYIIRICGDTPFVDIVMADSLLDMLIAEGLDYVAPDRKTCASAFFSEAVSLEALKKSAALTQEKEDIEHVTRHIINHRDDFRARFINAGLNPPFIRDVRLTIDYPEDIKHADLIVSRLADKVSFASIHILEIIKKRDPLCPK